MPYLAAFQIGCISPFLSQIQTGSVKPKIEGNVQILFGMQVDHADQQAKR